MNGYDRYLDFQYRRSGNFFTHLFRAIQQADHINLPKLALGFPEEVEAYKTWTRIGVKEFLKKVSLDMGDLREQFMIEYGLKEPYPLITIEFMAKKLSAQIKSKHIKKIKEK